MKEEPIISCDNDPYDGHYFIFGCFYSLWRRIGYTSLPFSARTSSSMSKESTTGKTLESRVQMTNITTDYYRVLLQSMIYDVLQSSQHK